MKVFLGADHAGFALKEALETYLRRHKYDVVDLGNTQFEKNDDYPDFAFKVGEAVARTRGSRGVLVCGSGVGMGIVANKVRGIRATHASSPKIALVARRDDDANVISLGGRFMSPREAQKVVRVFLTAPASTASRHRRRLDKVKRYERKKI
ncbi:MAG: RpiB/LacA/LacB family sugar-phosphate isomerase [Patescibacteria group bacterium]